MHKVLRGETTLRQSNNLYDWLGKGIYFWEHAPERALEWAQAKQRRAGKAVSDAAVLGAIIELGRCFDLLDLRFTSLLSEAHRLLVETIRAQGGEVPANPEPDDDQDVIMRYLDCAVINFAIDAASEVAGRGQVYDTVRGAFEEGPPAFPGACVRQRTHIQVAVKNPECIIGYFRPTGLEVDS